MAKKKLAKGLRKYIRQQKMLIKKTSKSGEEAKGLIKELLTRYYGQQDIAKENGICAANPVQNTKPVKKNRI